MPVLTVIDEAGALAAGVAGPFVADTTMPDVAGGVRLVAGCTFCTVTEFAGAVAGTCVLGTLPAPGVPMPGNTVPSCKLPVFGCVAEGVVMGAGGLLCVAIVAGCFSGKLIGGNFGGTGIGA